MNIEPKRLIGSIITAVALMLCLGLGTIGVMVLGRGEDAIKEANSESDQNSDCQFTGASEQLIVYQAPILATSQRKAAVLGGETYPIIKQNNGFYLLQLADDDSGWANSQDGTTAGHCEDIPVDDTPLANFPTICTLAIPQEVALYSAPDLATSIGTVPAGTYLIESTAGGQYYVVLDATTSGWVAAADGQTAGACDALPVAPG